MNIVFPEKYSKMSDEELCLCARKDDDALVCLVSRYTKAVRSRANKFSADGNDIEDLMQEGFIGLFAAIKGFDPERASFSTFSQLCVDRYIIGAVRRQNRVSEIPQKNTVEFSEFENGGDVKGCAGLSAISSEDEYIALDELKMFRQKTSDRLSKLEYNILCEFLDGNSYSQVSQRLGVSRKSVDNALQRIRRKLKA